MVRNRGGYARFEQIAELRLVLDDEPNLFDLSTRFSVIVQEHVVIE